MADVRNKAEKANRGLVSPNRLCSPAAYWPRTCVPRCAGWDALPAPSRALVASKSLVMLLLHERPQFCYLKQGLALLTHKRLFTIWQALSMRFRAALLKGHVLCTHDKMAKHRA